MADVVEAAVDVGIVEVGDVRVSKDSRATALIAEDRRSDDRIVRACCQGGHRKRCRIVIEPAIAVCPDVCEWIADDLAALGDVRGTRVATGHAR